MSDVEVEDTEAEVEEGGVRAVYPGNVPIYPWNDPQNGTLIAEHEGHETPTGEESVAALQADAERVAAGEIDPITGQPYDKEDEQKSLESGENY